MNMIFWTVVALSLLFSATVAAQGDVKFRMNNVALTCPEKGEWFGKGPHRLKNETTTYEYIYSGGNDKYHCKYKEHGENKAYHFYIKGKECENCIELDATFFAVVIVADVILTTIIMAIVYKCAKKTPGRQQKASVAAQSRQGDIPLATQTYEPLRQNTRSQETYSAIKG